MGHHPPMGAGQRGARGVAEASVGGNTTRVTPEGGRGKHKCNGLM